MAKQILEILGSFIKQIKNFGKIENSDKWLIISSLAPNTRLKIETRGGNYILRLLDPKIGLFEIEEAPQIRFPNIKTGLWEVQETSRFRKNDAVIIAGCRYAPSPLNYRWGIIRKGTQMILENPEKNYFDPSKTYYTGAITSWKILEEERK